MANLLINLVLAALFLALAIALSLVAKNSFSCNFIRSQGGFPSTQEKPPFSNTSGNSNAQWKNRFSLANLLAAATIFSVVEFPCRNRNKAEEVGNSCNFCSVKGVKKAAVQRLQADVTRHQGLLSVSSLAF